MSPGDFLLVPFRSRRLRIRLLVLGLILSDLCFAFDKWGEVPKLQAMIFYHQHQCLNFVESPNRVILESDPAKFDELVELGGYMSNTALSTQSGAPSEAVTSLLASDCLDRLGGAWARLDEIRPPATTGAPPPLATPGGTGAPWANSIAFLHRRSIGWGRSRLVVIWVRWDSSNVVSLCPLVYSIAAPIGEPICVNHPGKDDFTLAHAKSGVPLMRVFAGQPDSANSSRFTIAYEMTSGRGIVEGRLNADDSVTLQLVDEASGDHLR